MALVAGAACLWGLWSLFFRPAERIAPLSAPLEACVVFAVIFVVVGPLALVQRARRRRPLRAWLAMGLLGVSDAINVVLFFAAMQHTSLAIAVLTHYLAPVLIALAAPLVLHERMQPRTWLALGSALGGLLLLLEPWAADPGGALVGGALGAGSAVFFAGNILLTKRIEPWFAPAEILAWHMPTAILTLLPLLPAGVLATNPRAVGIVAAGGLLCGAVAGVIFLTGLARVAASRASVLMLLEPLVAVIVGAVAFAELPGPSGVLGAGLVLYGAFLVLRGGAEAPEALAPRRSVG